MEASRIQQEQFEVELSIDIRNRSDKIISAICSAALFVFKALATVMLFVVNPPAFIAGAIIGLAFPEEWDSGIEKISQCRVKNTKFKVITGIFLFLVVPAATVVALSLGAFACGAHISINLSQPGKQHH